MQPLGGSPPTPCAGPRPQDPPHEKEREKLHRMVQFRASGTVWASSYGRLTFQSLGPICRERAQKTMEIHPITSFRDGLGVELWPNYCSDLDHDLGGAACTQGGLGTPHMHMCRRLELHTGGGGNPPHVQEGGAAHGVGGTPAHKGGGTPPGEGGAAQRFCTIGGNPPPLVCIPTYC